MAETKMSVVQESDQGAAQSAALQLEPSESRRQREHNSRAPYVRPELKRLGTIAELTRGMQGSVDDGLGGKQHGDGSPR
jgi:hypothetical protein